MYTITGLIVLGVFYIILNILTFTESASEVHLVIFILLHGFFGIGFFISGIIMDNWGVLVGLALMGVCFMQYKTLEKYYPY